MNPLDPWRQQLRSDPTRTVAGVLEGWLDRGPWQRTEPVDFLLDLTNADVDLSEIAAGALLDWTREKLTWDDRHRLSYGERAHASQLADALATLQRLDAPRADYQLVEQHSWFEARIRPLRFDEHLDLPRLLWLATAFRQTDERFLTRWLEMCGHAARLNPGWREWLRVGLTGLRKLPANTLPAEQQALAGLLLFEHKMKPPQPAEATEFAARQFEVLKELFHRGPQYWPSVLAEVRERLPDNRALPAWMPGESRQIRPKGKPVAPFTLQEVQSMAKRIYYREPMTESLWQSVEHLFNRRLEHARHTGESEYLVKTVGNLGDALLKRQPVPAILRGLLAWIRTAMDWDAGNAYLWVRLADCRRALGQIDAAEDSLWEAMRRFPDNAHCRTILAELLLGKGETDEAEALLRKSMDDFPDNAHCRNILAELLRGKGETDEAEALLRKSMDDFPDNAHCRTILAQLLLGKGETDEAEALLRKSMDDFPDNAHCRNILAQLLLGKGETDEAEALLRKSMDDFPDNAHCRNILAELLRGKGKTDEAEALLWKTREQNSNDQISRHLLAKLLSDRGDVAEAEKLVREVRQLSVDHEPLPKARLELPLERNERAQSEHLAHEAEQNLSNREGTPPLLDETSGEEHWGQGELRIPQFGGHRGISAPTNELADNTEAHLDNDPLIPWAAERAPLIRLVHGIDQPDDVHNALLQAARSGGAAELADAALRLLFPDEALPLEEALRARPDSIALRLFQAGQDNTLGLRIAETAPEAESVLHALYRHDADSAIWDARFRDAVLACADLTPPPAWRGIQA